MSRLATSASAALSDRLETDRRGGFLSAIPAYVFAIAVLAGLLHVAPVWRAQLATPPDWAFTGNWTGSPDYMQYRVWFRQTQSSGPLVADDFTSEPNRPHLPVVFYYLVGQVSRWTHIAPMFVYAYSGSLFAFALVVLLYATVRHFLGSAYRAWWVFLAVLVGGGFGAHMKILGGIRVVADSPIAQRAILEPLRAWPVFEDYRGNYLFVTLFDTHYLLAWLMLLVSVLALYFTLREFSVARVGLTACLYAATTILHLYEGPTLLAITAAVACLIWLKGLEVRPALATLTACTLAVVAVLAWQAALYSSSGLPMPSWRAVNILFSTLLIAYPLAWGLIAWGLTRYWREAGVKECFLLGWALGCVALTLAGPFYPYPDRGVQTLQIPIYVVAGAIFFSRHLRVTPAVALVAILVLGATPAWMLVRAWQASAFDPDAPYAFVSPAHREVVELLRRRASESDVLLVDKSDVPWKTDDLWLAPDYPGRWYASHFFLTVDYERKVAEVARFFDATPEQQATFLQERGIRFLYVDAQKDPRRFEQVPGLTLIEATSVGALFEYSPGADRATN